MSTNSQLRYRRLFVAGLSGQQAQDHDKRKALRDAIKERLGRLADGNSKLDLQHELDALEAEYQALCEDPLGYMAEGRETVGGSQPITPPPPQARLASVGQEVDLPGPARQSSSEGDMPSLRDRLPLRSATQNTPAEQGSAALGRHGSEQTQALPNGRAGSRLAWVAVALSAAAFLVTIEAQTCGLVTLRCSDSGWIATDRTPTRVLRVPHNLGVVPSRVSIQFSPTAEGRQAWATEFRWDTSTTGNPVNVSLTSTNVEIHIYGTANLRGVYNPDLPDGPHWTQYTNGFFRVFAWR